MPARFSREPTRRRSIAESSTTRAEAGADAGAGGGEGLGGRHAEGASAVPGAGCNRFPHRRPVTPASPSAVPGRGWAVQRRPREARPRRRALTPTGAGADHAGVFADPWSPTSAVSLPPRRDRASALLALMGTANPGVRHLALGIRATARRHFEQHVPPLVLAHWPAMVGQPSHAKLRIGACDLYASAPYTRPLLRAPPAPPGARGHERREPAPAPAPRAGAARPGGHGDYRPLRRARRRAPPIVLVAAFIVVVDHVFDHAMTDPPESGGGCSRRHRRRERGTTTRARAHPRARGRHGRGLAPDDRAAFDAAMERSRSRSAPRSRRCAASRIGAASATGWPASRAPSTGCSSPWPLRGRGRAGVDGTTCRCSCR